MSVAFPPPWKSTISLLLAAAATIPLRAQLVAFDGFGGYAAGAQVESGTNGSGGTGLNGGAGWGGAYDINNAIKTLVRIENRSSNSVNYTNGDITILGGNRALRFYDSANGSCSLARPLGTVFNAAAGDTLWFSVLFRTADGGDTPLADQDFFQIGFDDNPAAPSPRVSIGTNATQTIYPSPCRFFVRSTTTIANSDFYDDLDIAAVTTYLLVARIQANAGVYDRVSLFVNPSDSSHPGTPSAEIVLPSGLSSLSHAFIRTVQLDSGDVNVLDEWHIGRDYGSVVQALPGAMRTLPAASPGTVMNLRWPVSLGDAVLETSTSLSPGSWSEVEGPFSIQGAEREFPVPVAPNIPQRFFRLRR